MIRRTGEEGAIMTVTIPVEITSGGWFGVKRRWEIEMDILIEKAVGGEATLVCSDPRFAEK